MALVAHCFFVILALGADGAPIVTSNKQLVFAKDDKPSFGKGAVDVNSSSSGEIEMEEYDLKCGITKQVHSGSNKYDLCPAECPYFAQNREDTLHCTFLCVPGDQCGKWNPNKPIPDSMKGTRTCRGPRVNYCVEMAMDGTDSCKVCQSGFDVHQDDGGCYFSYWFTLWIILCIVMAIVVTLVVWIVDMCCRENVNPVELEETMKWRERSKILTTKGENGEERKIYPWNTNLCRVDIAGPGMVLHMRYQAFLIFWSLVIAVTWTILACFHNELFILGTRRFGTPRQNCILVAWGYETQQRLMFTKVGFLAVVYLFTFVSTLVFAVYQDRIYKELDEDVKTYKDFALELKGLPPIPANAPNVEKLIKEAVEAQSNNIGGKDSRKVKVVGVSVAWWFTEQEDQVMQLAKWGEEISDEPDPPPYTGIHKWMYGQEKGLLGPNEVKKVDPQELLGKMVSSSTAYVVFETEGDKNHVFDCLRGIKFDPSQIEGVKPEDQKEVVLVVSRVFCEPAAINWNYFGDDSPGSMMNRAIYNVSVWYTLALSVWFFLFYVPYAISLYNFNYDNGAELPSYYGLVFTMVVVGGNATMYVVCDMIAENIQFLYKDTKQVVYVLMYLAACTINVLLDMGVTYVTALKIMVGLDFRTYHGQRLAEITSFTEQFETYAMQRLLAENTYAYAFPSTFLIPFLLEPFVTIIVPLYIGRLVVSTHREVTGQCAENYLMAFEFDLGRYADVLLNVFLGILIFYFPGGYTWSLFYGMFISHIVIYSFDHWRIINVIPALKIVSNEVDWWAQVMLIPCCSMILSCLVFKANCESYVNYCVQDMELIYTTTFAGVLHFIVHFLLFVYLVPTLSGDPEKKKDEEAEFKTYAAKDAHGWFSVNPVHCLRSQYILKDKIYSRFCSVGKEDKLKAYHEIGVFFEDVPADVGETVGEEVKDAENLIKKKLTGITGRIFGSGAKDEGKK